LIIIDNILVLPKVVESIFETIYSIHRDNKTRKTIPLINNSTIVK